VTDSVSSEVKKKYITLENSNNKIIIGNEKVTNFLFSLNNLKKNIFRRK